MTKSEEIYLALRRKMVDRTIAPGTRFRVVTVAEQFSASPVLASDAILLLFRDGYVKPASGTGYQSMGFGPKEVTQTYAYRRLVEPRAAALAAVQPVPKLLEELEYHLVEMSEALGSTVDAERFLIALAYFDSEMVLTAGDGIIAERSASVMSAAMFRYTVFAFDKAAMMKALELRHVVREAVRKSDGEYAASATEVALDQARHALLASPSVTSPTPREDWLTAPDAPDGAISFGRGEPDIEPLRRSWVAMRQRRKHVRGTIKIKG